MNETLTAVLAGMGLVEMHSHLLPGIDDGSRTTAESIRIARRVVTQGYSKLVCTPHIWPSLPGNTIPAISQMVSNLQADLNGAGVELELFTGGEINLREGLEKVDPEALPTYGGKGKHYLVDAWIWDWEPWLTRLIHHLQRDGRTVIMAHPERLGLIQEERDVVRRLADMGVLFQGNLYCFADAPDSPTRQIADDLLDEGRYFMLAGDLHREETLASRYAGLEKVVARVGKDEAVTLLRDHPLSLIS